MDLYHLKCVCGHLMDEHSCAGDVDWESKPDSSCYAEEQDELCECTKFEVEDEREVYQEANLTSEEI